MSLQSTVYKINNDLISSFATLDSWYDRDQDFLEGKINGPASPLQTIQHVMVVNAFILSLYNREGRDAETNNFDDVDRLYATFKSAQEIDLLTYIPIRVKKDFQQKFSELSPDGARSLMRDQLFYFLCILDRIHDHRLDIHGDQPLHMRSELEILQVFCRYLSVSVLKCESKVEWVTEG